MRKIARYYSILMALVFVIAIVVSIPDVIKQDFFALVRMLGISILATPLFLAAVLLRPNKHRWERYALIGNQILSVVSALVLAWTSVTPGQHPGVVAMLLLAAVLNWAAMAESDRTKTLVIAGFGIWTVAFFVFGASVNPETERSLVASTAVLNVMAIYILGGGIVVACLTFGYIKLSGIAPRQKTDPLSKAFREGDLAFRNELDEGTNPYAGRDQELADAWLSGHSKASAIITRRNAEAS